MPGQGSPASTGARRLAVLAVALVTVTAVALAVVVVRALAGPPPLPAFPGAEGFGASTPGGRGGTVIPVTTLEDSGPGSLRAALEAEGPRIVVFRVAGTIVLDDEIAVTNPYLTVAGQSAPGGGITLRAHPDNTRGLVDIHTHDVVIRFLRFRPGPPDGSGENVDGLGIWKESAHDVVIDHNSFSWAVDENVSTWDGARDLTFSWNIISEGLSDSTHPQGPHSKGMLVSGARVQNVTVHHNLFAHNTQRNPQISLPGTASVVNNVVYNYGQSAILVSNPRGNPRVNVVGNVVKPGPDSERGRAALEVWQAAPNPRWQLYTDDEQAASPRARRALVPRPFAAPRVTTTSARQAYDDVLERAGALVPYRDEVDDRVVQDVREGTGRIIDDPWDVGGWPDLPGGRAPVDTDGDGMPDDWERTHGLDPRVDDSADDRSGDGYTNIEEYLNSLVSHLEHG